MLLFARNLRLETLALVRLLGLGPWLALGLAAAAAALQEPAFFRSQQLALTWPFIYCLADIWALASCVAATPVAGPRRGALARAVACSTTAAMGATALVALTLLLDALLGLETPWGQLPFAALRWGLIWIPIALLGQSQWGGARTVVPRFALLATALAVQLAIHPLTSMEVGLGSKLLASALAGVASLVTMSRVHL